MATRIEDVGDLDGDGHVDLALGAFFTATQGVQDSGIVVAYRGDDLFVNANLKRVFAFDFLSFTVAEGVPGKPCAIFEKIVNGPPAFLKDVGRFDVNGRFVLSGTMPPGFAGIDVLYSAFALNANNKVIGSGQEPVQLR